MTASVGGSAGTRSRGAGGVEFGIYLPQVALEFESMVGRALECERLGLDSFWLFDHLYTPGAPAAPSFEGWTLATALLARTSRLRLGHLVTCNTFRHPALLAKMATTLDVISGGRLEFGIGSGSYEQEHREAGLPWGTPGERADRLAEALDIITQMFEQPVTTYSGRYYDVHDLPNVPQPVQRPRPPVHIGGAGPKRTLPLVARYADVWNVPTYALDRLDELNRAMDAECERIGRDPASLRRSVEGVLAIAGAGQVDEAVALARRRYGQPGYGLDAGGFTGTPARVTDRIAELVDAGFTSFVFITHDRASTETLELLAGEVLPCFPRPAPAGRPAT
ncbi:TIGR03560 family F420-dependent LLM class oxidoreductase [Parafrankia elaeagni]|uniref:TIGR03560 family F420-dependent LLM class oxidoreductase n=1 Tax=Parafrankia elaeagni TaxID=222534 RepID=UPI000685903F|nr:TIGR03560 family F420-dependent LLM class oxidoreductase [Parafrankia elaeagni]